MSPVTHASLHNDAGSQQRRREPARRVPKPQHFYFLTMSDEKVKLFSRVSTALGCTHGVGQQQQHTRFREHARHRAARGPRGQASRTAGGPGTSTGPDGMILLSIGYVGSSTSLSPNARRNWSVTARLRAALSRPAGSPNPSRGCLPARTRPAKCSSWCSNVVSPAP